MSDKLDKYHFHEIVTVSDVINSLIDDLLGRSGLDDESIKWCEEAQEKINSVMSRATELKIKLDKGEA